MGQEFFIPARTLLGVKLLIESIVTIQQRPWNKYVQCCQPLGWHGLIKFNHHGDGVCEVNCAIIGSHNLSYVDENQVQ